MDTRIPFTLEAMVVGEGKPYVAALVVLNPSVWRESAAGLALDADAPASLGQRKVHDRMLEKLYTLLRSFPTHARVRAVWLTLEPRTIESGLITPTLKLKRPEIGQRYAEVIRDLYAGHTIPA